MLHGRKKVIQVWNDVNYDSFHFGVGGGGVKEEEMSMKLFVLSLGYSMLIFRIKKIIYLVFIRLYKLV